MQDLAGKQVRAKSMRIVVTKVVVAIPAAGYGFLMNIDCQ